MHGNHEPRKHTFDFDTWEECDAKLKELRLTVAGKNSSPLLFRGQANSEWQLTTTLDRSGKEKVLFLDYFNAIRRIAPAVESFTGVNWDIPDLSDDLSAC